MRGMGLQGQRTKFKVQPCCANTLCLHTITMLM